MNELEYSRRNGTQKIRITSKSSSEKGFLLNVWCNIYSFTHFHQFVTISRFYLLFFSSVCEKPCPSRFISWVYSFDIILIKLKKLIEIVNEWIFLSYRIYYILFLHGNKKIHFKCMRIQWKFLTFFFIIGFTRRNECLVRYGSILYYQDFQQ